jgi:maltoporin
MKKLTLFTFLFVVPGYASAIYTEFNGYLRTGVGVHERGGPEDCLNNPGAWGNEFRIGNECDTYGETTFNFMESKETVTWKAVTTFTYQSKGLFDFETSDSANGVNPWVIREAYVEGALNAEWSVWAGKRFYRWGDIYFIDFFPIDMSGPGAGATYKFSDNSKFKVAFMRNAKYDATTTTASGPDIGRTNKNTLHLQYEEIPMGPGKSSFWGILGMTPHAEKEDLTAHYKDAYGGLLAAKYEVPWGKVQHEFAYAYGQGVMSSFGPSGDLVSDCTDDALAACTVTNSKRQRAWWETVRDSGTDYSWETAVVYDHFDTGTSQDSLQKWLSVGGMFLYHQTEKLSWMAMLGSSSVTNESDNFGTRNLWRVTVGPEFRWKGGIWNRPLIRTFVSHTGWNNNLKNSTYLSAPHKGYNMSTHVGVQAEVWF